jgi:hypothetical protein
LSLPLNGKNQGAFEGLLQLSRGLLTVRKGVFMKNKALVLYDEDGCVVTLFDSYKEAVEYTGKKLDTLKNATKRKAKFRDGYQLCVVRVDT